MKKILFLAIAISASTLVTGCCGYYSNYSYCSSCSVSNCCGYSSSTCCGSNGWY